MSEAKLNRTPLHRCHLQLGARMVPFAGYEMPVQYTGVLEETRAVRTSAGLFDVSHMGQISIRGPGSMAATQKLVTNQLSRIAAGQAQYNMLCNPRGGVIDDLIIYNRGPDWTYICCNAGNRAEVVKWMQEHLPKSVTLTDESDDTALIAIQGPNAEKILVPHCEPNKVSALKYYWAVETTIFGVNCYLSRTGYTGEDGFELYLPAKSGAEVWEKLLDVGRKHGLVPVGLGARDTLRLEQGYPLHGHELGADISPLEANLAWVVKLTQEADFIGKDALKKEAAHGPKRRLKGFALEDRRIPRSGYRLVTVDKKVVGTITSGTFSPHRNGPVALGLVDASINDSTQLYVEVRESLVLATRAPLPFVPPKTKK